MTHTVTTHPIQRTATGRAITATCTCGATHVVHEGRPSKWISFETEARRMIDAWAREHAAGGVAADWEDHAVRAMGRGEEIGA